MMLLYKPIEHYQLQSRNSTTCQMVYFLKYSFKFHEIFRVGARIVEKSACTISIQIDLELTEKSAAKKAERKTPNAGGS